MINMKKTDHITVDLSKGTLPNLHKKIVRLAGHTVADLVTDYARKLRARKN